MGKNTDKTELFETMPIPKAVAELCIPAVITTMVMVIYNLADTFFVGALNDPIQTSGVSLAAPVLLAFNAITNLFGIGTSSSMSRALGRKDYDSVHKISAFGFYCALGCSVLFALSCLLFRPQLLNVLGADASTSDATSRYLFWTAICGAVPAIMNMVVGFLIRSEGAAMHGGIGTMSGCLLNIILDPICILPWGLNMGAAGAGFATFISNCVACSYFAGYLFVKRGKTYVCVDPRQFRIRADIALDILKVGIPASIQNLLNVTGMTVLNNFTAAFGSAAAVAAMGISHRISMIPVYLSMGISQGIMPLISYNFAGRNIKRMKESILFTTFIALLISGIMSVLMSLGSGAVITAFLDEAEVISYGSKFLRGMALAMPFLAMDFTAVAIFQACGMGGKSLVFAIMRKILLEIPALFILNAIFPLYGLAYAQFTAEFVLAIAAIVVLRNLFRKLEA